MVTKRPPARERLLSAVNELFYAEGIHAVGIDRVIERAGVAKGSLFYNFSGKDDLIAAYLEGRHERRRARFEHALEGLTDPVDKLLAIFDVLHDMVSTPGYRGCAFANAVAEARPGGVEVDATARYRAWWRDLVLALVVEGGYAEPSVVADRIIILYDGATASSQLDQHPAAAMVAKDVARMVLESAPRG